MPTRPSLLRFGGHFADASGREQIQQDRLGILDVLPILPPKRHHARGDDPTRDRSHKKTKHDVFPPFGDPKKSPQPRSKPHGHFDVARPHPTNGVNGQEQRKSPGRSRQTISAGNVSQFGTLNIHQSMTAEAIMAMQMNHNGQQDGASISMPIPSTILEQKRGAKQISKERANEISRRRNKKRRAAPSGLAARRFTFRAHLS